VVDDATVAMLRSVTDVLTPRSRRPLIVHASSAAPSHRRVIHIEYAPRDLPAPLEWHRHVA
jgi:hypothetical protein